MKYKKNGFKQYCLDNKKKLIVLFLFAVLIAGLLYRFGETDYPDYLAIEGGEVVAVNLEKLSNKALNLDVKGELGDMQIQKSVTLKHVEKTEQAEETVLSDRDRVSFELSRIVRDINRGSAAVVELPRISPEGAKLTWTYPERGMEYLLPLFFPVLILFFTYRDSIDKEKRATKSEQQRVLRELPGFNNKLVLLLESGLIYDIAVERICEMGSGGIIEEIYAKAITEAKNTNGRAERIIGDYAKEHKISELSRLISIVSESRERGTDLREKLRGEGAILWDKRRRQAEEQGKLADTKLALPLGMMLISLLIVTAAPALMQF